MAVTPNKNKFADLNNEILGLDMILRLTLYIMVLTIIPASRLFTFSFKLISPVATPLKPAIKAESNIASGKLTSAINKLAQTAPPSG